MHSPIAVFTYNRPAHTRQLIQSLLRSPIFERSHVTIYCDGPKVPEHEEAVSETRNIIRNEAPANVEIIERSENFGLARSVITGVSELCEEFGRVIVLEDDLVLAPHALNFMNESLARYEAEDKVMHVSAYMYPVKCKLPESFFYREATCWGWATWKRAWQHFEPNSAKLVAEIDERGLRRDFNNDESMYFYQMLRKQRDGELDSWAIRWYASMFRRDGLALHPGKSLVQNLGFDGSGVHCNVDSRFEVNLSDGPVKLFPKKVEELERAFQAMIAYRNRSNATHYPVRGRIRNLFAKLRII